MSAALAMDVTALRRFLREEFPQALEFGAEITRCEPDGLDLSLETADRHLRPGGTVSGPTLMTLGDAASYYAILARVGPKALAVTSSLEIHFLRRPRPGVITAHARLTKLGRRTSVVQVEYTHAEVEGAIAIATVTYAMPA